MKYEYHCTTCKEGFTAEQSMKDDPLDSCPRCGERPQRVITGGAGFVLKGGGWYRDGYSSGRPSRDEQ